MNKISVAFAVAVLFWCTVANPQIKSEPGSGTLALKLPAPVKSGGMSLAEALAMRRSIRTFASNPLTERELSQLLWSAQGISDDKGHRTAPSAMGNYFLTLYVATEKGLFQYNPELHSLSKLNATDLRAKLSPQPSISSAPAVFIVAGDYDRALTKLGEKSGVRCVDLEAGHSSQNLLLEAVALDLVAVPVGGIDPSSVAAVASLPKTSQPIYLIPVGHPK